jgi:oligopeptide transport system substrate-binding protein
MTRPASSNRPTPSRLTSTRPTAPPLGRRAASALAASALLVGLAACGSSNTGAPAASSTGEAPAVEAYNPINLSGTAPGGPLIPSDSEESGRKTLLWQLFDGLVRVDASGEVVNEVAQSIETDDATTFTITINTDRRFSNGEAVTASSFVDAWNWGALGTNAQIAAGDYATIKGFDEVHPSAEGATPSAQTLSGLKLIDEKTFTVELSQPWSSFPKHLVSVVFYPLPKAFFEDQKAWVLDPIGNGPYQLKERIDEGTGAKLEANPQYVGGRAPQNTGVYYRFYTDRDAAYQDALAESLDIASVPTSSLQSAQADFDGRYIVTEGAGPTTTLTFDLTDPYWTSANGLLLRQAISHAVDRQQIIDAILGGLASPAREFTQKSLVGWSGSIPGSDVLDFDPTLAKSLYAEAGGWPSGQFKIYYNADGGHKEWVEAVVNQLRTNLDLDAVPAPITTFPDYLERRANHEFTDGAYRASEISFYPGLDDMLRNVYSSTGGSSSGSGWHSEDYEELLSAGRQAADEIDAIAYFNQAQEVLLAELPAIPLWYTSSASVYSSKVHNVTIAPVGGTQLHAVTKDPA